jgi:Flp pilus assembly protein TadG
MRLAQSDSLLRHPVCRRSPARAAAASVEFAVVAVAFFIIVLGMIEIGRAFMVQHLLAGAARQGARVGILPGNGNNEIGTAVGNVLTPAGITTDNITVTVNDGVMDAGNATTGQDITVLVSVPANTVSWLPFSSYVSGNLTAQYTLKKQ